MTQRTRVKICGMTRPEDALQAALAGADAVGLVFHVPSPRYVTPEQAQAIVAGLPPFVSVVGLFVNAPASLIEDVLSRVSLNYLQFHGEESPEACERYRMPYIKVARVKPGLDLVQYAVGYRQARALLVDAYVEGVPGGTGQTFDWDRLPRQLPVPLILSGGLNAGNVGQAINKVRPWAVDVSSGVESAPGLKDAGKVLRFIQGVENENLRHA